MENPVMNDLEFYSKFAKPLIINLPEVKDRILASKWVQKIQNSEAGTEALRTNYLKLLLFALQRQKLVGIFADDADTYEKLDPFPDEYDLNDMAKDLIEKEQRERIRRIRTQLRGQQGDWPPYTTDCSSDFKEYVAAQDIPGFGVHCYYAISKDPVYKWAKAEKGIYPKTAKSAVDTSGTAGVGHDSFSDSCVCPPKDDPSGEAAECKTRAHEKDQQDQPKDVKKKRPKRLGKSPPTSPLGVVVPPTEERPPPLWGSNLMEVRDQPVKEAVASPVAGPSSAITPPPRHHPTPVQDVVEESDSDLEAVEHAIKDFKRGSLTPGKKKTPSKSTPGQASQAGQEVPEEDVAAEPSTAAQQEEEFDDLFGDLQAVMRQAEIGEDEFLLDYFRKRLAEAETKQELAAVTEQIKQSSPASAGIPVTTPRHSVSPRRVPGGIQRLIQDDDAVDATAADTSKDKRQKDLAQLLRTPTLAPRTSFSPSPRKDFNLSRLYEQAFNLDSFEPDSLDGVLQQHGGATAQQLLGDSSFPSASLGEADLSHMTPGQQEEYKRTLMEHLKTPQPPPLEQEAPQKEPQPAPLAPIVKGSSAAAPVLAEFVNVMEKSRKKEQSKLPRKGIPTRKGTTLPQPKPAEKSSASRIPSRPGEAATAKKSGIKPPSTRTTRQKTTSLAPPPPSQPPAAQPARRGPPSPVATPPLFSRDPAVRKAAEGMVYPDIPMDNVNWVHGPDYFARINEFEPYDPRQMDIEDVFGIQPGGIADQQFFNLAAEPELFSDVELLDAANVSPMQIQMPYSPTTKNLEYPTRKSDDHECECPEDIAALTGASPFDMLSDMGAPDFYQSPTSPQQRQPSPPQPRAPSPVPGPSRRVTPPPAPPSPQPGPSWRVTPPPAPSGGPSQRIITPTTQRGQYRIPIGPRTRPGDWVSPEVTPPMTLLDTTPPAQMMPPMSPTGPKTVQGWRTPPGLQPRSINELSMESIASVATPCGVCSPLHGYSLGDYSGDISPMSPPKGESFHDSSPGSYQQQQYAKQELLFDSYYSDDLIADEVFDHEDLVSPKSFYGEDDIPLMYSDPLAAIGTSSQFLDESMPSYEEPGMEHVDIDIEELQQQQLPAYLRRKKPVEQEIADVGYVEEHYQPQPMERQSKRGKAKLKKPERPELTEQEERYIEWAFMDDKETGQLVKRMSQMVADVEQDQPDPYHIRPVTPELPQIEGDDLWLGGEMLPEADLPRSPGPSRIPGVSQASRLIRPPGASGFRPPSGTSGLRPPGASGIRPPGASGIRPPGAASGIRPPGAASGIRPPGAASGIRPPGAASGIRPPGAVSGIRPPGASGIRPPGAASGLRPPSSKLRPPGGAPPCTPCEGVPATPSGIRPPGAGSSRIRPPGGARPSQLPSGLRPRGAASAPSRPSGIPTPGARAATSGIPTPGAKRRLRPPTAGPSCVCPGEAPPQRPREPTPLSPWHVSPPSGEAGLMDDQEMAEFYRQQGRWDLIEGQVSRTKRRLHEAGEDYDELNISRPRTDGLGSAERRQIELLCRQALGPTPPPPTPYQPYMETPRAQQRDGDGRQRRGGRHRSRLPPGARRRRLDDEYVHVEADPIIDQLIQSHPDLPPLPPAEYSPDRLVGTPPAPGIMDEPLPINLPSPMSLPAQLPGWRTPRRLRKEEPKRPSPQLPELMPNWMFQTGDVESLGDIATPCGICSPGDDIHSPVSRTPSPQMPMEEQRHTWMSPTQQQEDSIEYLSDMEAPCEICSSGGSRTPTPSRPPQVVSPRLPPRPVLSRTQFQEAHPETDMPSPPGISPTMFDGSPPLVGDSLYTPPSGTAYRTPTRTAAAIFEQYGFGTEVESPSRTPIGPRLISPERRELFERMDDAEGRAGIKRKTDRSRYNIPPPLHAIPEIPPPPPKPPTPAPARFPPRDPFGLPRLRQVKVKTPPLQVQRLERRPLQVAHGQHPDDYLSPTSPCQPCAADLLGPLDEPIPEYLPEPIRPRPDIPGWTTPPHLMPKKLRSPEVQWPDTLPRYELGPIPPTPPSVGSREASFYTPEIPMFTTPPSFGYREPSHYTPPYSPPPCSPCSDGYSLQDHLPFSGLPSPVDSSGASASPYFSPPPMDDVFAFDQAAAPPVLHASPIGDDFGLPPYRSPEPLPPQRRSPTPPPPRPRTPRQQQITPQPPPPPPPHHLSPTSRVVEQYLAGEPLRIDEVQVSPVTPHMSSPYQQFEYYQSPLRPLEVSLAAGAAGVLGQESMEYQSPCTPCSSSPATPQLSPQWDQLASAKVHHRISPDDHQMMADMMAPSPPSYMSSSGGATGGSGFASPSPHMDLLDDMMTPHMDLLDDMMTPPMPPRRQRPPPTRDLLNTSFMIERLPSPLPPKTPAAYQSYRRTPPICSPPLLDASNPMDLSTPELRPHRLPQQQFLEARTPRYGSPIGDVSPPPPRGRPRIARRSPEMETRRQPSPPYQSSFEIHPPHQRSRSPGVGGSRTPGPGGPDGREVAEVAPGPGPCGICGGDRVESHSSKTRKFISVMPPRPPSDLSPIYSPSAMSSDGSFDGGMMPPEEAGFRWMDR